ncbi:hypothetical protein ONZ45_g8952 [Pleurotus djamor]|nr:hypothetical protein ONZ45_g8952 [Pleurotus djamor]
MSTFSQICESFDFDAYDNLAFLPFPPVNITSPTRESFDRDIDSRGLEGEYNIQLSPLTGFVAQMTIGHPANDILSAYPSALSSAESASGTFDSQDSNYGASSEYAGQLNFDAPEQYTGLQWEDTMPPLAQEIGGRVNLPPVMPTHQQGECPSHRFKCDICKRAFSRRYNMQKHRETHDPNREKPFVCTVQACQRPFSRKHDLSRHTATRHKADRLPLGDSGCHGSRKVRNEGVKRVSKNWGPVQQPGGDLDDHDDEDY